MPTKWVYRFDEVDLAEKKMKSWEGVRSLLGGKGANLAEMTRIGVPVPPGFTVTTEACNAYLAKKSKFPEGMWEQTLRALKATEAATGKKFGDPKNPLLVSCRSGAKFSMPGMMDTVLNIGLNDETAKGMIDLTQNERFVYDAYRRLVQMFGTVVMGVEHRPISTRCSRPPRPRRGTTEDSKLSAEDLKELVRTFKEIVQEARRPRVPDRPDRAAAAGDRSRLPLVERQARRRLPQRGQDRPQPGHGGQHRHDGLRQHGR